MFFSAIIAKVFAIYRINCEETPYTKRKRFNLLSEKVFEPICDFKFKTHYRIYKQKMLPKNHRTSKRVNRIVGRILESNPEFAELQNKNWSVFVVKDPENVNAFVFRRDRYLSSQVL